MQHNWYATITAQVLMAKDISSTQKLIIALISNLSNEKGYCYATNSYISDCLGISSTTISHNISDMEDKGYLTRIIHRNELNQIDKRFLKITDKTLCPKTDTLCPNSDIPMSENDYTPMSENRKENNKLFKNKDNITQIKDLNQIIKDKQSKFIEHIRPYVQEFGRELCTEFFNYWSEANLNNGKLRWELQKTFEIKKRLLTWQRNKNK